MKKLITIITMFGLSICLISCAKQSIIYTDDEPFVIHMRNNDIKILQITDLHLTYGIDYGDQKTFSLISQLVSYDDYDLIVITGDLTMSPQGPRLFSKLIKHMESFKIPWTFVFGNHETDFHSYQDYLKRIKQTQYLYFKVGPKITDGGVGNFKITFMKDNIPFYHAYFLDSKAEKKPDTYNQSTYDYINAHQVAWYENSVSNDATDSIIFMHIPLIQFDVEEGYVGVYKEKRVYHQGKDEGFFDAMMHHGRSKAVFVGHDHMNDFKVLVDGILLAYGRVTGFNGYGNLERGGRHIMISEIKSITTHIILESDLS